MVKAFAVFEAGGELQPYEYEPGALGSTEVEIDVEYCGICHSDLSIIDNEWGISQYPVVAGHEVVGKVSAVGNAESGLAVGQRVGLGWHAGYCNSCSLCNSGDHNLCAAAQPTIVGHHGGFAESVRAQADSVVAIPDSVDPASAGPLFCAGITVFNPLVQFDIKPTDKVAVIGIGGLGHLALQFLRAWGCEVTAFTSSDAKRKEYMKLGANYTLKSLDSAEIEAAAGNFDLVLTTVNVKLDWNLYLNTLKPRGRLHFVGATLEPLDIAAFTLIGGQRSVSGSPVGSPATIAQMLDFAGMHGIKPVIERFNFSEINQAIARLRSGEAHYRIVLER
ncbi:MAG: NAD(P)-dependent alcohol dehydrogenase [Pseudomonadales bacterium]|nr:NAD(P)-dependent alcohol dehydrogenase [Gammaproteobacteria bacterium]NNL57518.1 NAD(P)-dependent alcohol dehydrogenase [Pseudomonadales bacterium]